MEEKNQEPSSGNAKSMQGTHEQELIKQALLRIWRVVKLHRGFL